MPPVFKNAEPVPIVSRTWCASPVDVVAVEPGPYSAEVCAYGNQAPALTPPANQSSVIGGVLATSRTFRWTVLPPIAFIGLTADRAAPQPANTPITFTASATGGSTSYQYRWWLHDGTGWQMLRDWTTSAAFAWTPPTANAAYRITVWVKNADSVTTTWDASASMPFAIQ